MRLPRVRFTTRPSIGVTTVRPGSESPWKWLILLGMMLATICVCIAIDRRPAVPLPVPVLRDAASNGSPICRGVIVSIEIDDTALSNKLRRHNSHWVVTVRRDDEPSGGAPGREMRFSMHSPSTSGFRRVGERVEVYDDDRRGVWATPYPSPTGRVTRPR
jgi:hypothetical protein